mgnify:FL=1|jgi:hypothetical protein
MADLPIFLPGDEALADDLNAITAAVQTNVDDIAALNAGPAWTELEPSSGFMKPDNGHFPLSYVISGGIVHICGSVKRTGGNIADGTPTIIATVPAEIAPATLQIHGAGSVVQNAGAPARETQIRPDLGMRFYGAFATDNVLSVVYAYPVAVTQLAGRIG